MRMLASGPPPHPPGFLNSLAGPLDHFGYWAVLLFVMIEDFGVPVPGETILIAAAVYAGAGRLNVLAVGVIGFVAAVVGDNIGFAIGHYGGRALVLRWGRYVRLTGNGAGGVRDHAVVQFVVQLRELGRTLVLFMPETFLCRRWRSGRA